MKTPSLVVSGYFLTCSVFFILIFGFTMSKGMFMDGLMHSVVAKNIYLGIGSFWHLVFSKYSYNPFYEHPPLAFYLQSLFFRLFGDHLYVERIYSLFSFLCTAFFVVQIWFATGMRRQSVWLPVFLFMTTPIVYWCYNHNMLENTMAVFTTGAVYFILKAYERKYPAFYLMLTGFFIALALLTKGPVGAFPLATFILYYLVFKKENLFSSVLKLSYVIVLLLLFFAAIYIWNDDATDFFRHYFAKQITGRFLQPQEGYSHFFIFERLFSEILPETILALVVLIAGGRLNSKFQFDRFSMLLLAIAVSASFPIALSVIQSGYYLMPALVFYALFFARLISINSDVLLLRLNSVKVAKSIGVFSTLIFIVAMIIGVRISCTYKRDYEKINDAKQIVQLVGKEGSVSIGEDLNQDWNLRGYLERYGSVSLDYSANKHPFLLSSKLLNEPDFALSYSGKTNLYLYRLQQSMPEEAGLKK